MDTTGIYFDCLCRTCMSDVAEAFSQDVKIPQQQCLSIFDIIEEECGALRIAELLTNAVPQIEVQPSDELPKIICSKCLQQLLDVNRFQQMCLQSQEQMRQKVSKIITGSSIPAAPMEGEMEANESDSYHLIAFQPSSAQQNLEHTSIQEPLLATTEQVVKPEAAGTSDVNIDQLQEYCGDAEGNFSENIKKEPIEDDEPSMEYSDDELSIESEEQQITETQLKAHRIEHDEDKPYEGPYCPRRFKTTSNLDQHKTKRERVKQVTCDICGKSFSKTWIKRHKLTHGGEKPHKCHLCERRFIRKQQLGAHLHHHKGENTHVENNPQTFSTKSNMLQHKGIHEEDSRKPCDICGKSISNKFLKEHILSHSDEKVHKCDICEKRFVLMSQLRRHSYVQHSDKKPYKCKYCEQSFSHSSARIRHMRLHLGENVYRCELCPLAFAVASELRNHLTAHINEGTETRERNIKALKEAEAELGIKSKEYKKANSIIQEEDKPYECQYCPERFSNYANMLQHKGIHKDNEKYIKVKREACDICGKIVKKCNLKQHNLTHGLEKPHKCHLCEKSFSLISNLRDHIRRHTGEKPFKCKYCKRSFYLNGGRIKHMRVHLGDNVHRCELCPSAFPLASELRIHVTTHKNEDPETRERNMEALKEAEAKIELQWRTKVHKHPLFPFDLM